MNYELISGSDVIKVLAEEYQQLYLRPGAPGTEEAYANIVRRGQDAPVKDLSHFITSPLDTLGPEETPAGPVQVITLHERADFELFLQIMAFRCTPEPIPASQGASILDGVICWKKIYDRRDTFFAEAAEKGELFPDWNSEFSRFTSDKRNYTGALVILSRGPYSAIPAEQMGLEEEEWLRLSGVIRRTHECTHFLCRRLYREKIDPVWDELVADAAGLFAAYGRYDLAAAERFLGMEDVVYDAAPPEIYTTPENREDFARKIHETLPAILREAESLPEGATAFDLAVRLEEKKEALWG